MGMYVGATGDDAAEALHKASGLAHELARQLAAHPELKALMPPQVQLALKAIKVAAWAARTGKLDEVARHLAPQAARVVARVLRRFW
jgi:hypothetical protein